MSFWIAWQSRIIAVLIVLASLGGIYAAGYLKGGAIARAECRAEALIAQLAETERQRLAAEAALEEARKLHEEQTREIAALTEEAEAYVAQLQSDTPCLLGDDDVRRLRALDK